MKAFRILFVLLLYPILGVAGVCDTAWNGDKLVASISGRPASLRVPLRVPQQQITEVTAGQIQAFGEAKNRIAAAAGSSAAFVICGDQGPNAFAIKGNSGDIVGVTVGMLKLVNGDADIAAAVIGHEFAHHTHSHAEAGASRDAFGGLARVILGMVAEARPLRRGGIPANDGQASGQIGALLVARKFSRDQEREADATGLKYIVAAGFNPNGAIHLAARMNLSLLGSVGLYFDSHPGWDERGQRFQSLIAASPQAQKIVAQNRTASAEANPAGDQAGTPAQTAALAPAYVATDAQKTFTTGLAALRNGNIVNALRDIQSAADTGHPAAQAAVGFLYAEGVGGLPRNDLEAVRLSRLAADQGNAQGQANLGVFYANGRGGLPRDEVEAVRHFRLAAEQGNAQGQAGLGVAYSRGAGGVTRNDVEAVRLYRLAADQGYARGQADLGLMYASGRGGLPRDRGEAVRLFRLAADQGNAVGQLGLGIAYENGLGGVSKDLEAASSWYGRAAKQGNSQAAAALRRLGKE